MPLQLFCLRTMILVSALLALTLLCEVICAWAFAVLCLYCFCVHCICVCLSVCSGLSACFCLDRTLHVWVSVGGWMDGCMGVYFCVCVCVCVCVFA